jgi:hypothetical protein
VTADEELAIKRWNAEGMLDLFRAELPVLWTDLDRQSILTRPNVQARIDRGIREEGSSTAALFVPEVRCDPDPARAGQPARHTLSLGANQAGDCGLILAARLLHELPFTVIGKSGAIDFEPAVACGIQKDGETTSTLLTPEAVEELSRALGPNETSITLTSFPELRIAVHKSEISDASGKVIRVVG